ncbi:MAG: hypothetical protein ACRBCK_10075 [Alphaproteobacteria bacterium]
MDIEDLKKALESDEGKELLQGIVDNATRGLKTKNDELLGDVKKLKGERDTLRKVSDDAEAAKLKAEEDAVLKSGDLEKITAQLNDKHQKELQKRDEINQGLEGTLSKLIVDGNISSALTEAKVAPELIPGAKALIKSAHKTERAGENALIDGADAKEFVSQWTQSDAGKHYVGASDNGGGGAGGSNGGASGSGAKSWDECNTTKEKTQFLKQKNNIGD